MFFWVESQENVNSCFLWERSGGRMRGVAPTSFYAELFKNSPGHHPIPPVTILCASAPEEGAAVPLPHLPNQQHPHRPCQALSAAPGVSRSWSKLRPSLHRTLHLTVLSLWSI